MLCLQKIEGRSYNPSLQPEKVLLKPALTRFGRSIQHSDVVIDSSISPLMISRVHAEIHFDDGRFRIDCKGLNGLLVNKTKRSSAVLCDGDEIVFGGAGVKTKEGQSLSGYDWAIAFNIRTPPVEKYLFFLPLKNSTRLHSPLKKFLKRYFFL